MSALPGCQMAEAAVGYALHALEPADEEELLVHLPACHVCRESVRRTEEMMFLLASVDAGSLPRSELRAELLAEVAGTVQTPRDDREPPLADVPWGSSPAYVGGRSLWNPPRPVVETGASERAQSLYQAARRRRFVILVATLAFALIGFGGMAARQVEGSGQGSVEAHSQEIQAVLARAEQRGVRHALLKAPSGAPVAVVILDGGERLVVPVGLMANDSDQATYVLWGIGDGAPAPLGAFDVAPDNHQPRSVGSMPRVDAYPGYAVSVENSRKMPDSPSLMVIASGQVAN